MMRYRHDLDDPADTRKRVEWKGRVILKTDHWRVCPTGATFHAPPTMPERRAARPHLSQVEREALAAIRAAVPHHGGSLGRKSLAAALYGHPNPPLASSERMQEAVDRLASLGLITIEPTRAGPVFRAVKEEA
jgi:hypothetical protein